MPIGEEGVSWVTIKGSFWKCKITFFYYRISVRLKQDNDANDDNEKNNYFHCKEGGSNKLAFLQITDSQFSLRWCGVGNDCVKNS